MASLNRLKPGDILYEVRREKMGNVNMYRTGWWEVKIISVDLEKRTAEVSWNGNPPRTFLEIDIKPLRRSKPKVKT